MPKQLTILEKLLLAAYDLVMKGEPEFTAEDLVIAAWRKYPDAFGLSGHLDAEGKPAFNNQKGVVKAKGSERSRNYWLTEEYVRKWYEILGLGAGGRR